MMAWVWAALVSASFNPQELLRGSHPCRHLTRKLFKHLSASHAALAAGLHGGNADWYLWKSHNATVGYSAVAAAVRRRPECGEAGPAVDQGEAAVRAVSEFFKLTGPAGREQIMSEAFRRGPDWEVANLTGAMVNEEHYARHWDAFILETDVVLQMCGLGDRAILTGGVMIAALRYGAPQATYSTTKTDHVDRDMDFFLFVDSPAHGDRVFQCIINSYGGAPELNRQQNSQHAGGRWECEAPNILPDPDHPSNEAIFGPLTTDPAWLAWARRGRANSLACTRFGDFPGGDPVVSLLDLNFVQMVREGSHYVWQPGCSHARCIRDGFPEATGGAWMSAYVPEEEIFPLQRCLFGPVVLRCPASIGAFLGEYMDTDIPIPSLSRDRNRYHKGSQTILRTGLVLNDLYRLRTRSQELHRDGFASFLRWWEGPRAAEVLKAQAYRSVDSRAPEIREGDGTISAEKDPVFTFMDRLSHFMRFALVERFLGKFPIPRYQWVMSMTNIPAVILLVTEHSSAQTSAGLVELAARSPLFAEWVNRLRPRLACWLARFWVLTTECNLEDKDRDSDLWVAASRLSQGCPGRLLPFYGWKDADPTSVYAVDEHVQIFAQVISLLIAKHCKVRGHERGIEEFKYRLAIGWGDSQTFGESLVLLENMEDRYVNTEWVLLWSLRFFNDTMF
mmetsp:Transcript_81569/g.218279  ORF Transcript_81569/g.218279 Transcript_81569/m.218279 type:complete len:676 (-) Transcript_81569:78-2105(-)